MNKIKNAYNNACVKLYLKYPRLVGFMTHPNVPEFLSYTLFMTSTGVK